MNLDPKARGENVARTFCQFHGHHIADVHGGEVFSVEKLLCTQCGALLKEIRESSPDATHASEQLKTNPE